MTQSIKKEFFAYRNGIIAQKLRAAGDPHTTIMGCQLADVVAICSHYEKSAAMAQALWNEEQHRECRMAATMLCPAEELGEPEAIAWCQSVESIEIADVLCHRLLRHLPYANDLWRQLLASDEPLVRYTAWRLLLNLLLSKKVEKTPELRTTLHQALSTATPPLRQVLDSIAEEM